jgi:hypothetical protein
LPLLLPVLLTPFACSSYSQPMEKAVSSSSYAQSIEISNAIFFPLPTDINKQCHPRPTPNR